MRLEFEIVHLLDGHLFDAESYELTSLRVPLTQCESGYYLVLWSLEGRQRCDEPAPGFRGPFASAEAAGVAMRELQVPDGAIERGSEDLPARAMPSRGNMR